MCFRFSAKAVVFIPVLLLTVLVWFDATRPAAVGAAGGLRIKQRNPVVNEGNRIVLTATDAGGNPVDGVRWSSGSPDIAAVDAATGEVRGVEQGFATLTATLNGESSSVFVVVARVRKGNGEKVPGDTKAGVDGRLYISSPTQNVILTATQILSAPVEVFAGTKGMRGLRNGGGGESLFAGPTAIGVDNGVRGGVYVTDTLNHAVRKIGFDRRVETMLGGGSPGVTPFDSAGKAAFEEIRLNAPRGVATDTGGNLFLADTDNHAIYYVDFAKREVLLLAGRPGESGKADGDGRAARFSRPAGLAADSTGRVLAVADADNDRVRLLELNKTESGELTCRVVTVGVASSARDADPMMRSQDREGDELAFKQPSSVSFDGAGNVNVVDEAGAHVIVRPTGRRPEIVSLAQPGSIKQAASVTTSAAGVFVLDAEADDASESLNQVTVGAPEITDVSLGTVKLAGGEEVVVTGKNFAPESLVVLGDAPVADLSVESATRIRFTSPKQQIPGERTLTVQTRGGIAQGKVNVASKPLSELDDGDITTIAGGAPYVGDGGAALSSTTVIEPRGIAVDGAGNVFFGEYNNHRVRRIDAQTGVITTVAGTGLRGFSGDGGLAVNAALTLPGSVALDGKGNIFFTDTGNFRVRRIDAVTGRITTAAGNGDFAASGDGGPATKAGMSPIDVAADSKGNLFITDPFNHYVYRVDAATDIIKRIAGNGLPEATGDDGPAVNAGVHLGEGFGGIIIDRDDNPVFLDGPFGSCIRRIDVKTGVISTIAGKCKRVGYGGDGKPASKAKIAGYDLARDGAGNLYLTSQTRIRRIDAATNVITTVAGVGTGESSGDGGPAAAARINARNLAVDGTGTIFLSELDFGFPSRPERNSVRRIDSQSRVITTIARNTPQANNGNGGPAVNARIDLPGGLVADPSGNVFLSDFPRIRRIDSDAGMISVFAGNGMAETSGDGGPASQAGMSPQALGIDKFGNLFVAETSNSILRRIDARTGVVTTVAGNGKPKYFGDDGPAIQAGLVPFGVAVDRLGNVIVTEGAKNRIRRIDAEKKTITTLAGDRSELNVAGFTGDNGPARNARLSHPFGVVVDSTGNIFFADFGNARIRRIDAGTGIMTTVAGTGEKLSGPDGPALGTAILPSQLAIDGADNLFFTDSFFHRVRRLDARTGAVTTVAGTGTAGSSGDEGPAEKANLNSPASLSIDSFGNLYILDAANRAVRVVKGIAAPQPRN